MERPAELVTSEKSFQPEAGTSKTSTGVVTQPTDVFTGASPVQATGDVTASMTATQPVEAPHTKRGSTASMIATRPVEAASTVRLATQPVEAPGARSEVHSQPTGTGSVDVSAVDQSLSSKRTVAAANSGVSDQFDLEEGRVRPTPERWQGLTTKIQTLLSGHSGS